MAIIEIGLTFPLMMCATTGQTPSVDELKSGDKLALKKFENRDGTLLCLLFDALWVMVVVYGDFSEATVSIQVVVQILTVGVGVITLLDLIRVVVLAVVVNPIVRELDATNHQTLRLSV